MRLFELLEQYRPSGKKEMNSAFSGIVFVEQRYVAYALNVSLLSLDISYFKTTSFARLFNYQNRLKFILLNIKSLDTVAKNQKLSL